MYKIDEGFLSEQVCKNLINLHKKYIGNYYDVNKTWTVEILKMSIRDIKAVEPLVFKIEEKYKFLKDVRLVNCQLIRWPEGSSHIEHIDIRPGEVDKWAFFLYLNEDFEGGDLILTEENKTIKPKTGKLVLFEAGKMKHKVNTVLKKERYTLAGWYI